MLLAGWHSILFRYREVARVSREVERMEMSPAYGGTLHWVGNSLGRTLIFLALLSRFSMAITPTVQPSLSMFERVDPGPINHESPQFCSMASINLTIYEMPTMCGLSARYQAYRNG